jgi:hypothetical protein
VARHVDLCPNMKLLALVVGTLTALAGCSTRSVMLHRPEDPEVDAAVTAMWTDEIGKVAKDGDWILTRSYYLVADGIATLTPGEDLSHASIYDAKSGTIIEAVSEGIREIPLAQLIKRNAYVIVVHPAGMTDAERTASVARARTKLGHDFDVTGMFGIDHSDSYYCSELVYWASQTEVRAGRRDKVVSPSDLMTYGEVVYWSGKRDDDQVMALAAARR